MAAFGSSGTALIDTLKVRLGEAYVLTSASDIDGYLTEARGLYRGEALAVVRPKDRDEVAFVLQECAKAGVPVVPQGGNTGLVGGGVPYGGVVLSLTPRRKHTLPEATSGRTRSSGSSRSP